MSRIRWLAQVAALAALPSGLLAQSGAITGQVTDQSTQQPIAGAQVVVVETNARAVTDQQGRYTLRGVRPGRYQVSATRLGYGARSQTVSVAAGETAAASFALAPSALEIGGLVVTASGREQRQRELGNAVGSIDVSEVELAAVPNMSALLQARSPGVVVAQNSGTVGTAQRIRIRGSNSISLSNEPLVIVDGVRVAASDGFTNVPLWQSPSRLNDINPEDVESVEVLKGPAAAALYGTAAANGVIQITTKRGRAGRPRWTAYVEQGGLTDPTEYPTSVRSNSGCWITDFAEGDCTREELDDVISFNPLEDPQLSPFKTGRRQQYGLSVSGGSDAVTYYVSGEVQDENGVYEFDGVDLNRSTRNSLRANLTSRITDRLNLTVNTGYVSSDLTLPDNDNSLYGVLLNGLLGSGDSTVNAGTYGIPFEQTFAFETGQESRRFTTGVNLTFQPLSWLNLVGTGGIDQVNRHDHDFVGPGQISDLYSTLIPKGYRRSNRVEVTNLTGTLDATARYRLRSDLLSTSSVGAQVHREEYHDTRAFGRGMAPGTRSLSGASELFAVTETTVENATIGAYGQQQLAWNDRLFLTGSVRGDDNSAFGVSAGFAWYPSFSASWVVSEEPFFSPLGGAVDNLRLRAAYGKSGLRPSFRDALAYFSPVSVRLQGADVPGVTLAGAGNTSLSPEVSRELEVGFDLAMLGERAGVEFTYYDKVSEDALVQRRLAPSLGLTTTRFENIGSVSNRGVEAQVTLRPIATRRVEWEMGFSIATNRNRLERLGEGIEPILMGSNRVQQSHREGYPLGGYWMVPVTYADENGDALLQVDEVALGDSAVYLGSPIPTREGSLRTALTLFGTVRLSGLLDYKGGHKQMNFTRFDRCAWEVVCPSSYIPEQSNLRDQAGIIAFNYLTQGVNTTAFLEDASFVKLREVSLSLGVPDRMVRRFGMNGLRLTLSGRNLHTWTDYTGFDPEVNGFGIFDSGFQTYDYYTQPPLRQWTARIDVNF
jgi:TonB-linked SusC/RagA family outer membrane protein